MAWFLSQESRRKLEQRTTAWDGKPLFRYFSRPEWADDLVRGRVHITTLDECRKTEDAARADKDEGLMIYESEAITGGTGDADFRRVAERLDVELKGICRNGTISGSRELKTRNAFILCCSEVFDLDLLGPRFGRFAVRLSDAGAFFRSVTLKLADHHILELALFRKVTYTQRSYRGLEALPGPPAFVKPPDPYEIEKEVRMIWQVKDYSNLSRFDLRVPAVRIGRLCERLS